MRLWFEESSVAKRIKDLTTIQLTTQTRDRLYRLKFRKTYDEFLIELCDLHDRSEKAAKAESRSHIYFPTWSCNS